MYYFAVEKRCLETIDVDSGCGVKLLVHIVMLDGSTRLTTTPTLLPELDSVLSVDTCSIPDQEINQVSLNSCQNFDYYSFHIYIANGLQNHAATILPVVYVKKKANEVTN